MSMVTKLNFKINDYTPKILSNPKKFEFSHKKINPYIANLLKYFTPTFFWILKNELRNICISIDFELLWGRRDMPN